MPMTVANVEMAKAWDGEEGDHWTEYADRYDASGMRTWARFLAAGLIAPADRVLDIGCGTGKSTRDAARLAPSGFIVGVDLSARMLELARQRAEGEGLTNIEFLQADAQVQPFDERAFDTAISCFGAMFFADRLAAFRNIARAVRPGGRLGLLSWRSLAENEWLVAIRDTLAAGRDLPSPPLGGPGPFGLADPDGVVAVLTEAGFEDVDLTPVDEPIRWGRDAEDAWAFVSKIGIVKGLSEGLDEQARTKVLADLRRELAAHETTEGVLFGSAAWLITARRV